MKTKGKIRLGWQMAGVTIVTLAMMMMLGMTDVFSMICQAESAGKVTASSANIRKSADPNSDVVGSATSGREVSIKSQTTGTDGKVWYQVYVDATTMGYIRSDLVKITDGSTPSTENGNNSTTQTGGDSTSQSGQTVTPSVEVTSVVAVEGKVKGSDSVRVRSDATTNGNNIVTTAARGQKVTVTGVAKDSEGKDWYLVGFEADGANVSGFIRSDYVRLSGDLTEESVEEPGENTETEEPQPEQEPEPEIKKPYETALVNDNWYLYDYDNEKQYNIAEFIKAGEFVKLYQDEKSKVKTQKIAIVIMVFVILILAVAVALLIFKMKDAADSMYFRQVEQETIRRRTADRPQRTPYSKPERQAQPREGKTSQNTPRPAGNQPRQGNRPETVAKQQTNGAGQPQNRRPAGQGAPIQGNRRPASAGQRPAQSQNRQEGQPVKKPVMPNVKPEESRPKEGKKPVRPREENQSFKSKNFMQEDDEFEFAFLNNWDEEE